MSTISRRTFGIGLVLAVATPVPATSQPQRTWTDAPLVERTVLDGSIDSPLLRPGPFDIGENLVVVIDYGDFAVKAFSLESGELAWQTGRRGQGPWELANPTDLVVGRADSVWVLDPPNQRMHVFGPDGSQGRTLRIDQVAFHRFALLNDGFFVAGAEVETGLVAKLSERLTLLGEVAAPGWVSELSYFSSELRMDADLEGRLAVAFKYTGRVLVDAGDGAGLRELLAVATGEEPEEITLTPPGGGVARRLAPGTRSLVQEVAVEGDDIYVLSYAERRDDDEWDSDVVDIYDAETGYRHSLRLNRPASGIAVANGRIVVVETNMLPRITEVRAK